MLTDLIIHLIFKHYEESWNLNLKNFVDNHLKETVDSLAGDKAIFFEDVYR
jgi:hypothetical protein